MIHLLDSLLIHPLDTLLPHQSFNEQEAVVSKIITELTEYMNDHRCTHTVMNEVTGYYRNLFKHKTLFDEAKILPRLHCRLRTKILIAQNEDVIAGVCPFQPLFHPLIASSHSFDSHTRIQSLTQHNTIPTLGIPPLRYVANDSVKLYLLKLMIPQFTEKGHYLVKEGQMADRIIFLVDGGAVVCRAPLATTVLQPSPHRAPRSPTKAKKRDSKGLDARKRRMLRNSFNGN